MQKRNPKKVLILHTLTLGLYLFYWCSKSRKEVNTALGRKAVPTVWFLIVPLGMFWWAWLYGEALEEVTGRQIRRDTTFGLSLIASLAAPSPPYIFLILLSSRDPGNGTEPLSWTAVIIMAFIFYIFYTIVLGIFPSAVQSRINKLNQPTPQPATPTQA